MRKSIIRKRIMLNKRPAAIRPLGITGKVPVRPERMDAIRDIKTMAGSPVADLTISVSQSCAWFLCFERPLFREPMKEDHNV
jgi:hypothetical protein